MREEVRRLLPSARQVIDFCLAVNANDKVCIIIDKERLNIGEALSEIAREKTSDVKVFVMEDIGERPEDGVNPLSFDAIADYYKTCTVSVYAAGCLPGELKTFRRPMHDVIVKYKIRHAHMPIITEEIMLESLSGDLRSVEELTHKMYDFVQGKKEAKITTDKGTDLTVKFGENIKWVACDGELKPGDFKNLPFGEVMTAPVDANGVYVVDGVLGGDFARFGFLDKNPITLKIKDCRVVDVECDNKEILEAVKKDLKLDENASRIGELGIGTNVSIKRLVGNCLSDEKFPGVHIAWGNCYPDHTGLNYPSNTHCDCVIKDTNLWIDGKQILKKGVFLVD